MLVGGPGRDVVETTPDGQSDVIRVRGGGRDRVLCDAPVDREDVLLIDESDRVGHACQPARVLLSGRPQSLVP